METSFTPDGDIWLPGFVASLSHQLFGFGTLLAIVLLVVAVGGLAIVVASLSDEVEPSPENGARTGRGGWFGDACAWACPWEPRRVRLPARTHARRRMAHSG